MCSFKRKRAEVARSGSCNLIDSESRDQGIIGESQFRTVLYHASGGNCYGLLPKTAVILSGSTGEQVMVIGWLLLRIPDWKELSILQRHFVWEKCVRPLMVSRRVTDSYGILILATAGIGLWTGAFGEPATATALTCGYSLLTAGVDSRREW